MLAAIKPIKPIKQAVHHGLIWLTVYHSAAWFGGTKPSQAYQAKRLVAACLLASLTFAQSRGNKLPVAQPSMRSDDLTGADWAVITEYMNILKPLKTATKRLEGRGKSGSFGASAKIIPIFEYLLTYYEQRINVYEAVNYNKHNEAPEDHIAINLRAAWQKADDYYSKLDDLPAYYAATILHPVYKY
jgi:hypothetical protein